MPTKKKRKKPFPTLWLVTLILIAALIAALYYLKKTATPLAPSIKEQQPVPEKSTTQPPAPSLKPKPQFDFYQVLPQKTTPPPLTQPNTTAKPTTQTPKPTPTKIPVPHKTNTYTIQVSAFNNYQTADSTKANLILQGYNVTITPIKSPKGTHYRVMVGPYNNLTTAKTALSQLKTNYKNSLLQPTPPNQ